MCVPPFKGNDFYFLETKCLAKNFMKKYQPHQKYLMDAESNGNCKARC